MYPQLDAQANPLPGALNRGDHWALPIAERSTAACGPAEHGEAVHHSDGLVEQVTTHTSPTGTPTQILRSLNKTRRLRRMRACVIAHADATKNIVTQGGFRWFTALVTLTYALIDGYEPEHITAYLNSLRNWASRVGFKIHYQWVMELQQRGAPHYHLLIWIPEGHLMPKPDDSGMWKHGSSNVQRATRGVGYLVKYVSKGDNSLHPMPLGARLFGTGGDALARLARHRAGLPKWLREIIPSGGRAHRQAFAGWVCESTGEIHRSPFVMRWGYDDAGNAIVKVMKRIEEEPSWARS